jgi:ankyrin repeat protein
MSLIESVKDKDLQALKGLIAGGADVNAVDALGRTALWWAAKDGHVECATALIDAKADVDEANKVGDTPLHKASSWGRGECVRVRRLCGLGGSWCLNATDVMLPLQLLIQHKASVNALNTDGDSPLHNASWDGHLACAQVRLPPSLYSCQFVTDMRP